MTRSDAPAKIRIGTRGSPLALKQSEMVCASLRRVAPAVETEIVVIKTSGDWAPAHGETPLSEQEGGKGLFAKELESALLGGEIDAAVHSMKDMDSDLPDGLAIETFLPREDPRDALLINPAYAARHKLDKIGQKRTLKLSDLPAGCRIGTSSVRRKAIFLNKRTDLLIEPFRGNVGTRLAKLKAGQVDATLLAQAGLKRLGLESEMTSILEIEEMLPAAGQGVIGIQIWKENPKDLSIFDQLNCPETQFCVNAERAALKMLDGSCHTPIGAYAVWDGRDLRLRVCVLSGDGKDQFSEEVRQEVENAAAAAACGRSLGRKLKNRLPEGFLF